MNSLSLNHHFPIFFKEERQKHFHGVNLEFYTLLLSEKFKTTQGKKLVIFPTEAKADEFCHILSSLKIQFARITAIDYNPFSSICAPETRFYEKIKALSFEGSGIVVTSSTELLEKLPPKEFLQSSVSLLVDQIITREALTNLLLTHGYRKSHDLLAPASFVMRGDKVDISSSNSQLFRITFFDDLIEKIQYIDQESNRTIADSLLTKILLPPGPYLLCSQESAHTLRSHLPKPIPGQTELLNERERIFGELSQNHLFDDWPTYLPLFFSSTSTLLDYFDHHHDSITLFEPDDVLRELQEFTDTAHPKCDRLKSLLSFSDLFTPFSFDLFAPYNTLMLSLFPYKNSEHLVSIRAEAFLKDKLKSSLSLKAILLDEQETLSETIVAIVIRNKNNLDEIRHHFPHLHNFIEGVLSESLYFPESNLLLLAEKELFLEKKPSGHKKEKKIDFFAEQLSTLQPGDYLIHANHGVGKFLGLESMELGGSRSDFVVMLYDNNDKIYVPYYKLNLIQKYASQDIKTSLANLRTNKFERAKSLARESVKTLAFDLVKLDAQRKMTPAFTFSPPDDDYRLFENSFPYQETEDQLSAIEASLSDMQKAIPMDRLICGDVGFGKTEIAMRAAFKAVCDNKQVAVLVPTTILALQHFHSFTERFANFPIKVDYISRFRSTKESAELVTKINNGGVDIIIGTHKLLSEKICFKDLGLLIIDEEHRFGVGHKEKLKLIKTSIDCLTLTATPIPRTLNLAIMGLKDLSVITTPPARRQAIQTIIVKDDPLTIKEAIERELERGGQIFYLHNRVEDIESVAKDLKDLVPNLSLIIAHGQLPEGELEKRMNEFYQGKARLLLCTTIVESGIDVPNANTLIVDRADCFGLAQLHQIRGRVGRSDRKAYAYFVIPTHKTASDLALKRLQVLQNNSNLGGGFAIASSDLDIRGAGNIIGGDQSGHLESIGLELYMELLQEAIMELRGSHKIFSTNIEITAPFSSFIPNDYIPNQMERLKTYKRLANEKDIPMIDQIVEELYDIHGPLPEPLNNLVTLLKVKLELRYFPLESLKVAGPDLILKFSKQMMDHNPKDRDLIIDFFMGHRKHYQFTQDYRVIYKHKESFIPTTLLTFAKDIAQQIGLC